MSNTKILNVEQTIASLYKQLCHYRSTVLTDAPKDIGMLFTLQLDVNNFGYEKDGETHHQEWERYVRRYMHVIITRKHQVFVAQSDNYNWKCVDVNEFENTANHDSCWEDGLCGIFDMYYKSWKACWKTQDPPIPKEHVPPPISSHITGTLNPVFGDGVFRFVKITTQPKDDYFYDLTGIKEVKFKIVLED